MDIDMTALRLMANERNIPVDVLVDAIEDALLHAYKRMPGAMPKARVVMDRKKGKFAVLAVEEDENGEAIGEFDDTPSGFDRIAAATARSVIVQRIRDMEDEKVLGGYRDKAGQLISGVVRQSRDPRMVAVDLGDVEAILPPHEQVPTENYRHGQRIRAYVTEVTRGAKGPSIVLSRTHPGLVRQLFSLECPEVADGTVEIVEIAREAGYRTKMAVRTDVEGINPKGSCIGPMGARVRAVIADLGEEKIDIVDYDDDPEVFVAAALSPAKVESVEVVSWSERRVRVVVPAYQYSLAIGKEGQNVRLAARLTGWKIDIHSDADPLPPSTPESEPTPEHEGANDGGANDDGYDVHEDAYAASEDAYAVPGDDSPQTQTEE